MRNKRKVALVTGASGFVGKHLSSHLLEAGWDVHAIIRSTSNINDLRKIVGKNLICHSYDGDINQLMTAMKNIQPTVVFHLASQFMSKHGIDDISSLISSNITFSTHLVEAMIQNGIYNLINTGTSWQHYMNDSFNPVNLYAATKQAFEDILKYYREITPIKIITLKLFDTYGPYDTRPKLFQLLNKVAQTNDTLKMSPGDQLIDIVYIDDVIEAFLLSAHYLITFQNYEGDYAVSSLNPIKLRDLVQTYEKLLGKTLNIEWGGLPYREREVMNPWNTGKILPGWVPKTNLEKGINQMLYSQFI
jgi:nucleoside-diphosphate-sugar epimerase